jgi:hypothetical protein
MNRVARHADLCDQPNISKATVQVLCNLWAGIIWCAINLALRATYSKKVVACSAENARNVGNAMKHPLRMNGAVSWMSVALHIEKL